MSIVTRVGRPLGTLCGLVLLWWGVVRLGGVPPYLLPPPAEVARALWTQRGLLVAAAGTTLLETVLGLALGTAGGAVLAVLMTASGPVRRWMMPLVAAQPGGAGLRPGPRCWCCGSASASPRRW